MAMVLWSWVRAQENGAGDTVGDADQRITFELAVCRGFSARLLLHCFFDFKRRREL
jgi:hypothetical protein